MERLKSFVLAVPFIFLMAVWVIALKVVGPSGTASAHSGDEFGPACGVATIDGQVDALEWSNAATQTFFMENQGITTPITATLHVMNSAKNLYLGITIEDDEFSTSGEFLSKGDTFRIYFDNDHSGSLFAPEDDVLVVNVGTPQFDDRFVVGSPAPGSNSSDADNGGTEDGDGKAGRIGKLNHFEIKHPLCSGDNKDFCLSPGETVGFRLDYLDAEADGSFGGNRFFPGSTDTSIADIVIGSCKNPDLFSYLPIILK